MGSILALSGGCATEAPKHDTHIGRTVKPVPQPAPKRADTVKPDLRPLASVGAYRAASVSGDYAAYPAVQQFIDAMVSKHGFEREYLNGLFSAAKRKQWTLDYLQKSDLSLKSAPGKGSWSRYKAKFLDSRHIDAGVSFWQQHRAALRRASEQFGVPEEYILGILAIETTFGSYVGSHRVIDALTTLAFDYRRREDYFRGELENFLLMARSEGLDPVKPVGSYAGAMGLGQFMPSSFLEWAVDFNGDGKRNLWEPEDAIGSVANYFARHGWRQGQAVVSSLRGDLNGAATLEYGLDKTYSLDELRQAGLSPTSGCDCTEPLRLLWLRHEHKDEYLVGYANFYTITRYNHSTHYAMAVHELAQAIKRAYQSSMRTG
ncbi:MAG: lytic murein transglycosylase B [Methylomonas sp.]|nr:lytic murein transglycosylase B [Methylomonas sp.]